MHSSENQFYTAISVAGAILGIIILVFIITLIRHQRRNLKLHKVQIRTEIASLEKERKRIANDLHDELGPILSAVRIQINHLTLPHEGDEKIVTFANKHIDDILKKTREISYNLLPNTLVRKGMVQAVREYVSKLEGIYPLIINLECNKNIKLPDEMAINIYRIIQEIIHNTIKHAYAKHLMIQIIVKNKKLLLITADDGRGFDYEKKLGEYKGLGLMGLQSRAEILNAKFNYKSEVNKGTQYSFEIPIFDQ